MSGKVVYTLDREGNYTWICKAVEEICGYKQEELIGQSAFVYIYPEDRATIMARFIEPVEFEIYCEDSFRVIDKDGSVVQITSRSIRKPDGTVIGVFDRRKDDRT